MIRLRPTLLGTRRRDAKWMELLFDICEMEIFCHMRVMDCFVEKPQGMLLNNAHIINCPVHTVDFDKILSQIFQAQVSQSIIIKSDG